MKRIVFVFLIVSLGVNAQSDPNFRQNVFNALILNPAQAGANDRDEFVLLGTQSWIGFEGAPKTLTGSGNFNLNNNFGLGVSGFVDQLGPISSTRFSTDLAYHLDLNESWKAAVGLRGMITSITVDLPSLTTTQANDPHMMNALTSGTMFDVGLGGLVYSEDYYFGVSMPKVGTTTFMNVDMQGFVEKRGFIGYGGANITLSESLDMRPSAVARYVGTYPLLVDLNAMFTYADQFDFGLNYQVLNSIGVILGFELDQQLSVGYAYSYPTSQINRISFQTHEVALRIKMLGNKSKGVATDPSFESPRFFN